MKINWFSPLLPARTGIADYTATVLPALCKVADVTLWTDQQEWDKTLTSMAKVVSYSRDNISWKELNRGGVTFYNMGNHHGFHGNIWHVCRLHPGVVLLHDTSLHDFFYNYHYLDTHDREAYLDMLELHHGAEGRKDAELFWEDQSPPMINYMSASYPLTACAIQNALGVIVHTQDSFESLKAVHPGLLGCVPLPSFTEPPRQKSGKWSPSEKEPWRLVLFGHLGKNRCIEAILKALNEFPRRQKFHLDIYGTRWDDDHFEQLVESLNLERHVTLHGFVNDAELDSALGRTHLAINLRYPSMGEASISQLRIWRYSLPSLVTKTGWYESLPDDTVAHIAPGDEMAGVKEHLTRFLEAPEKYKTMGENGFRKLAADHSPEAFAASIRDFAQVLDSDRGAFCYREILPKRVGAILGELMPGMVRKNMLDRVSREIHALGGVNV